MAELPFAISLHVGTSRPNRTGEWRTERPVYVTRAAPCATACPADEDVREWLADAETGRYEDAWRTIVAKNPFPAVMGRVCFRPCQTACNRGELDEAVGINAVERFLGDHALDAGYAFDPPPPATGRRVLVVGGGPAGLSAAYALRRRGHAVTIRESAPQLGGMLRYGIPAYRLPRDVLDAEIARILALGIDVETGVPVDDLDAALRDGGFDAAFVGVGAQVGRHADLPVPDAMRMLDAVSVLHEVAAGETPLLGRRVAVYGGGDTAMDAARTARRLGADETIVVYRRTRERMPAHDEEVEEALEEDVTMRWLSTIRAAEGGRVVVEKMALDADGFPQPTGELEELEADAVVLALGQEADLRLLAAMPDVTVDHGVIAVSTDHATGHAGVYAGGDAVDGQRTATTAIGHGRRAAVQIDAWLRGTTASPPPVQEPADFDLLNTWYYEDAPHKVRERLEPARRAGTFDEVVAGLATEDALFEARRCLSCGSCFGCDNCFGVCPDASVIKLADGVYDIDLEHCKGCGLCAAECPCGAIRMEDEPT